MDKPDPGRIGALPTANGTMARLAYAAGKKAGIELEPLLRKAGLTVSELEDAGARIKVRDQINFTNLTAGALGDDYFGYHLAQLPDLRELGWLYYVSASSDVLGDSLLRLARYGSIANEALSLKYFANGKVRISFKYLGISRHLDRHQLEFFLTILVRLCRHLTSTRLTPLNIKLSHHRIEWSELAEFFGCGLEYGAPVDEIEFSDAVRPTPVLSRDTYLNKLLISYCEEALSRRSVGRGAFRIRVQNAIAPRLPHGKVRAGEIARELGMSQRTFTRRLASEELSFSDTLEQLRSDLARRYFAERELSISQIAWLLGYQDSSAFTHAFKRWTGKTPREARSLLPSHELPHSQRNQKFGL